MLNNISKPMFIIIVINVVIMIADIMLLNFGISLQSIMLLNPILVFRNGDYYRILTYGFMHGSIMHLLFNMYALAILSIAVERYTSKKFTLLVYFVSLIISGIGVLFLTLSSTVGASGAIYGLFGALVYFAYIEYKLGYKQNLNSLKPILLINLAISFLPGISLIGHLFGFLSGIVITLIYRKTKRLWR